MMVSMIQGVLEKMRVSLMKMVRKIELVALSALLCALVFFIFSLKIASITKDQNLHAFKTKNNFNK